MKQIVAQLVEGNEIGADGAEGIGARRGAESAVIFHGAYRQR